MAKTIRERQRQLREDAILDTAYILLTERGYEKMTMDELATRVGIAKVTLYQHFASKEALTVGIIVRRMRVLEEDLQPLYEAPLPAMTRLEQVLRRSLEYHAPKWAANILLDSQIVMQDASFQEVDAHLTEQWERLIEQAKQEGAINRSLSTPVLVRMMRRLFLPGYEDMVTSGRATTEDLVHTLLTVIISGAQQHE